MRGMIALSRAEWKNADTYLSKVIHLKPKNAANYVNRALARYNINNLRGAMADYDTALDFDPNNFLAHYNRGLLRMNLGDDNCAIEDFDYVIRMEPHNVLAIFNRAILLDKTAICVLLSATTQRLSSSSPTSGPVLRAEPTATVVLA